jgi:hypothetical protein
MLHQEDSRQSCGSERGELAQTVSTRAVKMPNLEEPRDIAFATADEVDAICRILYDFMKEAK